MASRNRASLVVGVVAAAALALAGCGTTGGGSASPSAQPVKTEIGTGEGQLSILAWPGYVEDGSNDPAVDWVTPFETRDRVQGELQALRHLGRGRDPDAHRTSTTSSRPPVTLPCG